MRIGINIRSANLGIPDGHGESMRGLISALAETSINHKLDLLSDAKLRFDLSPSATSQLRVLRPFPVGNRLLQRILVADPWYRARVAVEALWRRWDVYVQSAHEPPPVFGVRARVAIVHDLAFIHPQAAVNFDPATINTLDRWTAQNIHAATALIAVSNTVARDIIHTYGIPPTTVTTAHHGVDHTRFHPNHDKAAVAACLERHKINGDYVLFVGTVQPRKNLPCLVEATKKARVRGLGATLVVAGADGWRSTQSFESIERSGSDVARYIGQVGVKDLPLLIAGARAFVSVARDEGFGMPALEAMASGVPVIVANEAGLAEVVDDAGLMVNPSDTDAIADALLRITEDETLRADMITRGLERARNFTWKSAAGNVWAAIEQACASF